MKTVQQIMQETGAEANIQNFRYMQEHYTYKQKIRHAENVARSYQDKCSEMGLNCHVSVGGLDSITLHYFLESCGVHVPCVSCSSLEQKGVQAVHKQIAAEMENTYSAREWLGAHMALPQDEIDTITDPDTRAREQVAHDACPPAPRMYFLKPLKPKTKVIEELGWPVLSKEIAGKISLLQNPTPKNATVRHAIITGETGEYGGFQKDSRMKLSQKWLEKFGGADAEGAALGYTAAPFKVSERCCYYLKEKPCDDWAKEHNSVPYLGLMASEGGRRRKSLMMHGCNYYGKSTIRSAPFAIFSRQDILQLVLDLNVPSRRNMARSSETKTEPCAQPLRSAQAVRCAVSASSLNSARTGLTACAAQTPKNGNFGCVMFVVTKMVTGMDGAAYSTTSAWNGKTNPASYPVKCLLRITNHE